MRLLSASLVAGLALASTGCAFSFGRASGSARPSAEPVRETLKALGVEGRSYVNDLGAVASVQVHRIHAIENDLLVEDIHGHLSYIDGATLFPRWAYTGLGGNFEGKPCATATAVVGVSKGRIHVLSRNAGVDEIAPRLVPVVPSGGLAATESTAYVPTWRTPDGSKTLQSVSLGSGYVGWGVRTETEIRTDLLIGGAAGSEVVYCATTGGSVLAFPASDASRREVDPAWTLSVHSQILRNMALDGGDLGIVTEDHRLMCVDRITGAIRWEAFRASGEKSEGSAQFSPSHAFYVCGGELRAYDRGTGALAWTAKGATRFVAERGMRTLLAGPGGKLVSVETKSGKVLGSKSLPGWSFPTRSAQNATVIGISDRGMLVSVETGF